MNNKKKFESPEMQIVNFAGAEIITASDPAELEEIPDNPIIRN